MKKKHTDHFKMLCDISELQHLFTDTRDIEEFLQKTVEMGAHHMHAAVCSIYLYHANENRLSISANVGLNQAAYKNVSLQFGEGLVGKALKELTPICCAEASRHPAYKSIPGLEEEKYDAFLAVPIRQGTRRIGVLVIQRDKKNPFTQKDIAALNTIASQLAHLISYVRTIMSVSAEPEQPAAKQQPTASFIKGKSGSSGYATGKSLIREEKNIFLYHEQHKKRLRSYTAGEFTAAVAETVAQLEALQRKVEETLSDVASLIFTAHLLMLKDVAFLGEMKQRIEDGENPPQAVITVGKQYVDIFRKSPNKLIREKEQDITDLVTRLYYTLTKETQQATTYEGRIVIAQELFPSDILKMASDNINGIILMSGGITSHVSILSRSLHIPLIITEHPDVAAISDGTSLLLDAEQGNIYIDPTPTVTEKFKTQQKAYEAILCDKQFLSQPTTTHDGTRIHLLANINLLSDLNAAHESYADGIGLYRTEFPFLIRSTFPTEEEQYVIYRKLVTNMQPKPITFRTLDIGGDKLLSYYTLHEQNPFLGFRSIRFSLKHKEVFTQQIRAILRAGHGAEIRIMFPMISSIDEFREAKDVLESCQQALAAEGQPQCTNLHLGIMIEIPSIVDLLDDMAADVDFFSIGTNDFIQFYLAVDRTNEKVASFYNPLHPSVIRALQRIAATARAHNIPLSVCGDMAHDERCIPFLIGIGITALSSDPLYIPKIKRTLTSITMATAQALAQTLCTCPTIEAVQAVLEKQ